MNGRTGALANKYKFRRERIGDRVVLHCLSSHYHSDCEEVFETALRDAEALAAGGAVVLALDGVALFSSSALRALRASHRRLSARGGSIVAAGGGELAVGVLKFAPFIDHHPSIAAALSAAPISEGDV